MSEKDPDDTTIEKDGLTAREKERLPQWAAERLSKARLDLMEAQAEADIDTSQKKTSVSYTNGKTTRFLPDGQFSHIKIDLSDDGEDWIKVSRRSHSIEGRHFAQITGSGTVAVMPQSGGTVRIVSVQEGEL